MSIVGLSITVSVIESAVIGVSGEAPGNLMVIPGGMDVRGLVVTTGQNGFQSLTCFIPASLTDSFFVYDKVGLVRVYFGWNGYTVWDGRLEDAAVTSDGVRITALGYWRAFSDVPFTSLFSKSGLDGWRPGIESEVSTHKPELYTLVTKETNRISINLKKGGIYASGDDAFYMLWELPDDSYSSAEYVTFDYSYTLPNNWTVQGLAYADGFASGVSSGITTSGGTASGTFTWDLSATPKTIVGFRVYNSSGSPYTNSSEEDAFFLRVDSVRVTSTDSTVSAQDIATMLAFYVNFVNDTQIEASSALIESPGVDLLSEVYEDRSPADILTDLAARGDGDTPWEVGVWEDKTLYFRERGSLSKTWYIDLSEINVERTISSLFNSAYAVYQAEGGRNLRTSSTSDSTSTSVFGLTRRASVSSNTITSTEAESDRDTFLDDHSNPAPRAKIVLRAEDGLFDAAGASWPKFFLRANDIVVVRNLPSTLTTDIDRIRSFRVIETSYSVDDDQMTITPEEFIPTLGNQVAKLLKGRDSGGDRDTQRR